METMKCKPMLNHSQQSRSDDHSSLGQGECPTQCSSPELMKVKCCLTFTETVGLLGTGAQDGHLDFHTALEL